MDSDYLLKRDVWIHLGNVAKAIVECKNKLLELQLSEDRVSVLEHDKGSGKTLKPVSDGIITLHKMKEYLEAHMSKILPETRMILDSNDNLVLPPVSPPIEKQELDLEVEKASLKVVPRNKPEE